MESERSICTDLEAYYDGELHGARLEAFERHLEGCPLCRRSLALLKQLGAALRARAGLRLPDEADLRLRRRLNREFEPVEGREILDIEGVAALLGVAVPEVVALLEELPAFELHGRLRFRRDRLLDWARHREQRRGAELEAGSGAGGGKIVPFPGGRT